MSAIMQTNDFVIMGPSVASGPTALNAVHALYFLPHRYKLVLPTAQPSEKEDYAAVLSLIERDGLSGRVQFTSPNEAAGHIVIDTSADAVTPGHVRGESPEALASAILNVTRSYA